MKIAKSTKDRIESIKMDSADAKAKLRLCSARLKEHAGTKRIASKLDRVIDQLDKWLQAA